MFLKRIFNIYNIHCNLNFNFQDRSRIFYKFEEVRLGYISNKHELLFESLVKF